MEVLHISLGITIYNGKNTGKSLDRWKWYGIKLLVTQDSEIQIYEMNEP
jgi:hypothetical protein